MATRQRIVRIRREYNQWVANQTLEDYALRFTAKSARRWSATRVANTALGAISFLALEAIGGAVTLEYGVTNAVLAMVCVTALIFATALPIAIFAARYGVDIDLLTRGAGFGYVGSTVTSLIYASFTFLFFAIEAAILATMLQACFGLPLWLGYVVCSGVIVPLVMYGFTFISKLQLWTQPAWFALNVLPFAFIFSHGFGLVADWRQYQGAAGPLGGGFHPLLFGAAASMVFSLVAQIGEQVDFLRFMPPPSQTQSRPGWWAAVLAGGPGWIMLGLPKLLAGSFLAYLAVRAGLAPSAAGQPTEMYRIAFGAVLASPTAALILAGVFIAVSQIKINVTNAYAGSIAWSNFFARLTHRHPGRVVWVVFNIAIALLLMEIGVYEAIARALVIYAVIAASWVGALVADLVVNKTLGLSPPGIEFKRAHLYDINPVGNGAMLLALATSLAAYAGTFGAMAQAFAPFIALAVAFTASPLIAWATGGRTYLARKPRRNWARQTSRRCVVCENVFEPEDCAYCPVYQGAICSLCCSLDARCHDACKPQARYSQQLLAPLRVFLPPVLVAPVLVAGVAHRFGRYSLILLLLAAGIGATLLGIYAQTSALSAAPELLAAAFIRAFFVLLAVAGVIAWLVVLGEESRQSARQETQRQTGLLMSEIAAHQRTDAALQKAKEVAEAANLAKSHFVTGISHELRTPLNAILGYAQLMEHDETIPARRRDGIRIIRRSGEHLAGLIEGLLDISKIEAGRIELYRDIVRLPDFLDQLVDMFRLQARMKGIGFEFTHRGRLPDRVRTDERRLRQILINLLSNAIKFTRLGGVSLRVAWRDDMAEFEVEDTGIGIAEADLARVFEPFQRIAHGRVPGGRMPGGRMPGAGDEAGVGLGLTITRLLTHIMGGEITVTSTFGRGSVFVVRLMLSEVSGAGRLVPVKRPVHGYLGDRRRILVVDDDPVHRGLVEDVLMPLGFVLYSAVDGLECLRIAARQPPDLFLLDIAMRGMSGWELARQLREQGFARTPIIMVSANANELTQALLGHEVHDDVLAKPISLAVLLEKIGRLLNLQWSEAGQWSQAGSGLIHMPVPPPTSDRPIPDLHVSEPYRSGLAMSGLRALTDLQLDGLRQLCAIGYVRGLRDQLDLLEQENPAARPYLATLRGLLAEFRLDAFMAALDAPDADLDAGLADVVDPGATDPGGDG